MEKNISLFSFTMELNEYDHLTKKDPEDLNHLSGYTVNELMHKIDLENKKISKCLLMSQNLELKALDLQEIEKIVDGINTDNWILTLMLEYLQYLINEFICYFMYPES